MKTISCCICKQRMESLSDTTYFKPITPVLYFLLNYHIFICILTRIIFNNVKLPFGNVYQFITITMISLHVSFLGNFPQYAWHILDVHLNHQCMQNICSQTQQNQQQDLPHSCINELNKTKNQQDLKNSVLLCSVVVINVH